MLRLQLNDFLWSRMKEALISCGVYETEDLRMTVEGILFKLRVGCPWRDLPSDFGNWNSIFSRFNRWSKFGILKDLCATLVKDPDHEWTFVDGSIVKAHQHSSGARKGEETAIGKSVAGNSTKIHLAVESCGLPISFELTGGQVHDSKMGAVLLENNPEIEIVTGDKGYDSEQLREVIEKKGAIANIPRKDNSKIGNGHMDWGLYKLRHLVENAFARLKHFRSIATRYEKLKRNYDGMLRLACSVMWLPM
jgi:transposase